MYLNYLLSEFIPLCRTKTWISVQNCITPIEGRHQFSHRKILVSLTVPRWCFCCGYSCFMSCLHLLSMTFCWFVWGWHGGQLNGKELFIWLAVVWCCCMMYLFDVVSVIWESLYQFLIIALPRLLWLTWKALEIFVSQFRHLDTVTFTSKLAQHQVSEKQTKTFRRARKYKSL